MIGLNFHVSIDLIREGRLVGVLPPYRPSHGFKAHKYTMQCVMPAKANLRNHMIKIPWSFYGNLRGFRDPQNPNPPSFENP